MKKNTLYKLVLTGATLGFGWVAWSIHPGATGIPDVCLFKRITGLPCPSCGTTHAVMQLFQLHFKEAFMLNPLGYVIAIAMIVLPLWVLTDIVSKRQSFYHFFQHAEVQIRRPQLAIPLLVILLSDWIWNLAKYTL